MIDVVVYGVLGLLWLAVIVLGTAWPSRENPEPSFRPGPVAVLVTSRRYEMALEADYTDRLLDRATALLEQ